MLTLKVGFLLSSKMVNCSFPEDGVEDAADQISLEGKGRRKEVNCNKDNDDDDDEDDEDKNDDNCDQLRP